MSVNLHCRYGKGANFELTKACLSVTEHPAQTMEGDASAVAGFASPGVKAPSAGFKTKLGTRLPPAPSPQYSRQPDFASRFVRDMAAKSDPSDASASPPSAETRDAPAAPVRSQTTTPRRPPAGAFPADAETGTVRARKSGMQVALMSGVLAISVAIITGMAISRGGGFQLRAFHALPGTPLAQDATVAMPGPALRQPAGIAPPATAASGTFQVPPQKQARQVTSDTQAGIAAAPPLDAEAKPAMPVVPPALAKQSPPAQAEQKAAPSSLPEAAPQVSSAEPRLAPKKAPGHAKKKSRKAASEARPRAPKAPANPFSNDKPAYTAQLPGNHVRYRLAQCDRISNLIRHERCKWNVCKNKWGSEGCPSYKQATPGLLGLSPVVRLYSH